jgi:pyruvate kinase
MKTKITATLGPASSSPGVIRQLIQSGVDVFRLNFSHGTHEEHAETIALIHRINKEQNTSAAIMADLQGPKIRLGSFEDESVTLKPNDRIVFTSRLLTGKKEIVSISYPSFAADVKPGETVLVDDGKIAFRVIHTDNHEEVLMECINGGVLFPRKGVNLPDTSISLPSLTEKDHNDLNFILLHEIHWIALSFVRSAADIRYLRQLINKGRIENKPRIVAKIEKPQAVQVIDQIILETDAVMIARGDLGVEMPMQTVPMIQKRIINACQKAGRPVIVATQMMEGMIDNIRPTRAEVNDVANSVLDGADSLMLSGETSVGKFPVKTVEIMQAIMSEIEQDEARFYRQYPPENIIHPRYISDSVLYNACEMARQTQSEAIIVISHSGYSALRLSAHRPKANVFVFTSDRFLQAQLSLLWGVRVFFDESLNDPGHYYEKLKSRLLSEKLIRPGMLLVNVLSLPVWEKGYSNTVRLSIC